MNLHIKTRSNCISTATAEMASTAKLVRVHHPRISKFPWNSVNSLKRAMIKARNKTSSAMEEKSASVCLISPAIRSYLARTFWQVSLLNGGPLHWNEDRVGRQRSIRSLSHFYVNFLYASSYTAFVIFRGIQVQLDDNQSQAVKIFMKFQIVYFCLCLLLLCAVIINRVNIPALINGILDTADACEGNVAECSLASLRIFRSFTLLQFP